MSKLIEVTVGVISRAHGVRGAVNIDPRTDGLNRCLFVYLG